MSNSNSVLIVENLCHTYRSASKAINVFDNLNLSLASNKILAVTGESGSGKSTLLLACGGMIQPTKGKVTVNGINLFDLSARERSKTRAQQIGFMFQTLELVPYLNVLQNVLLAPGATTASAKAVLAEVGLTDRIDHKPQSLSHGQRQRAALARAIVHRPALLIADEPTGNLDEKNTQMVFQTLRSFADQGGAVLVATHEKEIQNFADEVLALDTDRRTADAAA